MRIKKNSSWRACVSVTADRDHLRNGERERESPSDNVTTIHQSDPVKVCEREKKTQRVCVEVTECCDYPSASENTNHLSIANWERENFPTINFSATENSNCEYLGVEEKKTFPACCWCNGIQ